MDPATIATIVGWFAQPAAQALFTVAQTYVQQRLGLNSSSSPASQVEPLLDGIALRNVLPATKERKKTIAEELLHHRKDGNYGNLSDDPEHFGDYLGGQRSRTSTGFLS
jgi:hypothetical protein